MRFYNRKEELAVLRNVLEQSRENSQFTLLSGRRRIGKTALLLKAYENDLYLYLFVSRKSEELLLAEYQQAAMEVLGIDIFGTVTTFKEFFELLMRFSQQQHFTLIIDEFQDFERVNKSIFSDMQDVWDRYKDTSQMNLVVSGSLYSLLVRIFENAKEPLFGRLTKKIVLRPFAIRTIKEILRDYNPDYTPEDLLCLYLLTGGVPKYIALLMDEGATTKDGMLDFVTSSGSPFLSEGKEVLVSEFGKDYSIYFSILQLIASGKTAQVEIDSIIGKSTGAYLQNLNEEYSIITKNRPLFSKPGNRNVRWRIRDNYLRFWFRFIYSHQSLVETGRYDLLRKLIGENYIDYSGLTLEDYFRTKFSEEGQFSMVGSYWDRKGTNEIDLVALDDFDSKAVIAEIKRNPSKISLPKLQAKATAIQSELSAYEISYEGLSLDDM